MNSLKLKIFDGIIWTALESVINRSFDFLIQLILARFLFPEDYGIVGMASVFISLIQVLSDFGLGAALIQKKKESLTALHYHTAFWTGVFWSIILYLLMYKVITPLVADLYKVEELNSIIPFMCLSILFAPANLIHQAQLTKAMKFKNLAIINSISNMVAGSISLVMAIYGAGVWSLVYYSLIKLLVAMPLYFQATGWLPKLLWSRVCFKEIFGFGIYTTGSSIADVFAQKADYLIVGKLVGASALGLYAFAFLLTNTLRNQLVGVLNKVVYPIYVTLQDKPKELLDLYLKILSINMMLVFPIISIVFLFSEYFLPVFFNDKWTESVTLIKILSLGVFVQMTVNSNQSIFRACGAVKIAFHIQMIKSFIFFVPCIFIGVHLFGTTGAAIGYLIATLLSVVLVTYHLNNLIGLSLLNLINIMKTPFSALFIYNSITYISLQLFEWKLCIILFTLLVTSIYFRTSKKEFIFFIDILKKRRS